MLKFSINPNPRRERVKVAAGKHEGQHDTERAHGRAGCGEVGLSAVRYSVAGASWPWPTARAATRPSLALHAHLCALLFTRSDHLLVADCIASPTIPPQVTRWGVYAASNPCDSIIYDEYLCIEHINLFSDSSSLHSNDMTHGCISWLDCSWFCVFLVHPFRVHRHTFDPPS
jgi:hypothetical protein